MRNLPEHNMTLLHDSGPRPSAPYDAYGCPSACPRRRQREFEMAKAAALAQFGIRTLADMQDEVVSINIEKGWRGQDIKEPPLPEAMAMLHSEVSEALEAWRTHGTEDFTREDGKPEGVGSEFADILIRLLDDCDLFGIDLQAEYTRKIAFNRTRPYRHGGKAL